MLTRLTASLTLPMIGSPMFIVSGPELVIAQCQAGILGAFPALNARPADVLRDWLQQITQTLADYDEQHPDKPSAPFAVNQIVHPTNDRLEHDVALCAEFKVPLVITSLHAPNQVVEKVHAYGGLVFHDVTTLRHAKKAIDAGVDGLILVCHGAGGHAGRLNPFAFVAEVRRFYDGPLVLAGAISKGEQIVAAQALGVSIPTCLPACTVTICGKVLSRRDWILMRCLKVIKPLCVMAQGGAVRQKRGGISGARGRA